MCSQILTAPETGARKVSWSVWVNWRGPVHTTFEQSGFSAERQTSVCLRCPKFFLHREGCLVSNRLGMSQRKNKSLCVATP